MKTSQKQLVILFSILFFGIGLTSCNTDLAQPSVGSTMSQLESLWEGHTEDVDRTSYDHIWLSPDNNVLVEFDENNVIRHVVYCSQIHESNIPLAKAKEIKPGVLKKYRLYKLPDDQYVYWMHEYIRAWSIYMSKEEGEAIEKALREKTGEYKKIQDIIPNTEATDKIKIGLWDILGGEIIDKDFYQLLRK